MSGSQRAAGTDFDGGGGRTLYLLKGELQRADVWVKEGRRTGETPPTDFAYCPESGKECPTPPLSLKTREGMRHETSVRKGSLRTHAGGGGGFLPDLVLS